jgi:pyruvate,water dikinase
VKELTGRASNYGMAVTGVARHANGDASNIEPGDILVARETSTMMMQGIEDCIAIITQIGGAFSHASVVSRELNKPLVLGVQVDEIPEGTTVTVDPQNGKVMLHG